MSNNTKKPSEHFLASKNITSTIVSLLIILLIIVTAVGIASFNIGKNKGRQEIAQIPIIDVSNQPSILGAATHNWYGVIQSIEDSRLVITIQDNTNGLSTKNITAILKPTTIINRWDLTKPAKVSEPDSTKKKLLPTELHTGQQVILRSNQDSNDHDEVEASSLSVLITPN